MHILAFETSGPLGSAAITDKNGLVRVKTVREKMSHLRELAASADELLREADLRPGDIAAAAVSVGPGSFTGIRIGVTTCRTFAQALDIPCIAVSSLGIFRERCGRERRVAVIFNARRGQVYGALFDHDGSAMLEPGPYMLGDVIKAAAPLDDVCWYGDGTDAYAGELSDAYREAGRLLMTAPEEERYASADMVARAALTKYNNGELLAFGDLCPDYMRKPEAEQRLDDGTLARLRAAKLERLARQI